MEKADRSARSDEQKNAVAKWKQELRARKKRIDNTRDTEVVGAGLLVDISASGGGAGEVFGLEFSGVGWWAQR